MLAAVWKWRLLRYCPCVPYPLLHLHLQTTIQTTIRLALDYQLTLETEHSPKQNTPDYQCSETARTLVGHGPAEHLEKILPQPVASING